MTAAPARLSPNEVMDRLRAPDAGEWAFLDVREIGEAAEGHPFASSVLPYGRLEHDIAAAVPRRATPLLLFDGGDGIAARAARRLSAAGYRDLAIVDGGAPGWAAAGLPLFKGVHTWSKAFGEWVQHRYRTPEIGPEALAALLAGASPPVLIDGRPHAEHRNFTLPGALNCPNAELPLRLPAALPPETPVVVHCAGRTRSIIGAETLRAFGIPNPVMALRDGTQGWELAGFARDYGADRPVPSALSAVDRAAARRAAGRVMAAEAIPTVDPAVLERWLGDTGRTTYRFDPRDAGEGPSPAGFRRAPGTTLVQQTDRFVAVRGARVVLHDPELVRAVFAALWLRRMGIEAFVLDGTPAPEIAATPADGPAVDRTTAALPLLSTAEAKRLREAGAAIVDLRSSAAFTATRIAGALWSTRARLDRMPVSASTPVVVVAEEAGTAALAAIDLGECGLAVAGALTAPASDWAAAGFDLETGGAPLAAIDRIDEVGFCAGRHHGDLDDARAYLAWETGLLDRLDRAGLRFWPAALSPASSPLSRPVLSGAT